MSDERPAQDAATEPDGESTTPPEPAQPEIAANAAVEAERDIVAEAANPSPAVNDGRRSSRHVLAAVFWLLASLSVLAGGIALWAHQTLLTADGWGGLVEDVIAEEEVTDAVAVVLVDRLSGSLGVREVVAEALPGPDLIAGALTATVQSRITDAVADLAQTDAIQQAFVNVNKAAHDAALRVIRGGESEAVTSEQGLISINIFPLVEGVLNALQGAGIIDEGREIPDLRGYQPTEQAVTVLEALLGRDVPDDFGTIVLVESDNLGAIQTIIRWFDLNTVGLLLLWALFTALALWFSARRVRMTLWLSGGAIAALLAGRFLTRLLLELVTRRQPELEARVLASAIIDAAVDSLMWFTFVLIAVAAIVAVLAYAWERRDRLQRPAMETPPRTLGRWVKANMMAVIAVGIGLIAVVALWSVGGPGIALLTAAALMLLGIAVKVLSEQAEDEPAAPSASGD